MEKVIEVKKVLEKIDQTIDDIWAGREDVGISDYEEGMCQGLRDLKDWLLKY